MKSFDLPDSPKGLRGHQGSQAILRAAVLGYTEGEELCVYMMPSNFSPKRLSQIHSQHLAVLLFIFA